MEKEQKNQSEYNHKSHPKKNTHNNNHHKFSHKFSHKFGQTNLSGEIKENYKFRGHYQKFMETMYLNSEIAITRKMLYSAWANDVHINSVDNFLREAKNKGWIVLLKSIKGEEVNTAYFYKKYPDRLATGQPVTDTRAKYYQITDYGKRIYENSFN